MQYKFRVFNDRADKIQAIVNESELMDKDGEWKIAFISQNNANTLIVFERVGDRKVEVNKPKVTVTSEVTNKPKAPITIDE